MHRFARQVVVDAERNRLLVLPPDGCSQELRFALELAVEHFLPGVKRDTMHDGADNLLGFNTCGHTGEDRTLAELNENLQAFNGLVVDFDPVVTTVPGEVPGLQVVSLLRCELNQAQCNTLRYLMNLSGRADVQYIQPHRQLGPMVLSLTVADLGDTYLPEDKLVDADLIDAELNAILCLSGGHKR